MYLLLEPHVEQSVCLVQYQPPQRLSPEALGCLEVIQQSSWGGHQHCHAFSQASLLALAALAARYAPGNEPNERPHHARKHLRRDVPRNENEKRKGASRTGSDRAMFRCMCVSVVHRRGHFVMKKVFVDAITQLAGSRLSGIISNCTRHLSAIEHENTCPDKKGLLSCMCSLQYIPARDNSSTYVPRRLLPPRVVMKTFFCFFFSLFSMVFLFFFSPQGKDRRTRLFFFFLTLVFISLSLFFSPVSPTLHTTTVLERRNERNRFVRRSHDHRMIPRLNRP